MVTRFILSKGGRIIPCQDQQAHDAFMANAELYVLRTSPLIKHGMRARLVFTGQNVATEPGDTVFFQVVIEQVPWAKHVRQVVKPGIWGEATLGEAISRYAWAIAHIEGHE